MKTYNIVVINGKTILGTVKGLTKKQVMRILNITSMEFYTYKQYGCFGLIKKKSNLFFGYKIKENKK